MGSATSTETCCCGPNQVPPATSGYPRIGDDNTEFKTATRDPEVKEEKDTPLMKSKRSDQKFVTKTQAELDKISKQANRGHRQGICAEVVTQKQVENFVKPVYPKSPADEAELLGILKENEKMDVLCGTLSDSAMQDVVNAFYPKEVAKGDNVIKQGDQGDCLYVCTDGNLDIFVARPGPNGAMPSDRGQKVLSVGKGALFGELALMYSAPRAATVVVTSGKAKLWALDRLAFKGLLLQAGEKQFEMYEGWLKDVEILKPLNHHELSQIADMMESTLFDTDECIIEQGGPGDAFYIVEDGTCAAYIIGADGEREVKAYKTGDYFGEIALLTDEPRKATVRATGDGCTVLSVSKEDFVNTFGPILPQLQKDISKYPKYSDFLTK